MLGIGWIILIIFVAVIFLGMIGSEGNPNHSGGMKRFTKSKKKFGLVGLFLLLMSGLIFSNYIN